MAKKKQLDEPVKFPTIEEIAEQQGKESVSPSPSPVEFPEPPKRLDEMTAEEKAALATKKNQSTLVDTPAYTPETLADNQGKSSLNPPDHETEQMKTLQQEEARSFAKWAADTRKAAEDRVAEEELEIEREKKAAAATGWAEFGSALANLFGVGEGNAVSQTYKTYSQDWMKEAGADQREHRNRVHDLRQRQNDIELKMAQLRAAQGKERMQFERDREQLAFNNALAVRKADLDARYKAGELGIKEYEAETKRLQAQAQAEYNAGRLANDTKRTNAQAAASYSTASYNKTREAQLKNGGGSGSDILVTLGEYGEEPEETIHIKPESLVSTIQANYKNLSLSPEEERAIKRIVGDYNKSADQKADELKSLLVTNPSLRNLVRKSSSKVDTHSKKETQKAQPVTSGGKSTQDLINGL